MTLLESLKNPAAADRFVPFWSWNDRLEPDEIRQQVRVMHDAGIGGFFMHARGGLRTRYLGTEWFECVAAAIDEAEKYGMHAWAYDENGWPSGFGDGRVNGRGLDYQQKYLRIRPAVAGEKHEHHITFDTLDNGQRLELYFDVNRFYVDTLDAEVVKCFLNDIYDRYLRELPPKLSEKMLGFFTDEPQISRDGIPWSFTLEREYRARYQEELLPHLAELFHASGAYRQTRDRFWRLVTELFMNHFFRQIHDWCSAHGWMITGHNVLEERYLDQICSNGAVMPHYQFYHQPGIDWLGRHIRPVTTSVQLTSVCAQMGQRRILSETFAMCGWNVSFEELRWIAQYQMVHGINWICPHLEGYTLRGLRKRDYPAGLFFQQPWWPEYRQFTDYLARIGKLLHDGEIHADALVLHGQSTAWQLFDTTRESSAKIGDYWNCFNELSEQLERSHVAYHYGDETMIAMHGRIDGKLFIVGQQSYSLVIVPPMRNFSAPVVRLLAAFVANGGMIFAVRDPLGEGKLFCEGTESLELESLAERFTWFDSPREAAAAFCRAVPVLPVVQAGTPDAEADCFRHQAPDIACTRRQFADFDGAPAEVCYLVNNSRRYRVLSEIHLKGAVSVRRFRPETGEIEPIKARRTADGLAVPFRFAPAGDLVLVVSRTGAVPAVPVHPREVSFDGDFQVKAMTPNILTLDRCDLWCDGELVGLDLDVAGIQDRLLKLERPVSAAMEFHFRVKAGFHPTELGLLMENPELFRIQCNSKMVDNHDCGWLFDRSFRRVELVSYVHEGENVLRLETTFRQSDEVYRMVRASTVFESERNKLFFDSEIENVYLAGSFGVEPSSSRSEELDREAVRIANGVFTLTPPPETLPLDRMIFSGLPFFAGRVTLVRRFELAPGEEVGRILAVGCRQATTVKVRVNGHELSDLLWQPLERDLGGLLHAGTNESEFELASSLRNMLGPHHLLDGESYRVGPGSFFSEPGVFNHKGYPFNPNYCLVEFGLREVELR